MPGYVHSLWQRKRHHSLVTICQHSAVLSFQTPVHRTDRCLRLEAILAMQQPGKYEFTRNNLSMFSRPRAKIKRLEAKTGMNNKTKLQSLCEMRWARRANALYTFRSTFTAAASALEYMEADGNGNAWIYMLSIQRFDFIITLVTIEYVLQNRLPPTTFL